MTPLSRSLNGTSIRVDLFFPNSSLGLRGEAFETDGAFIDIITSDWEWVREAFLQPAYDQTGLRVIPLA
jgi:hypothetical protein